MHEINVTGYNAATEEKSLNLGTAASYGVEKLHITFDAAWDDLSKSATFNCGKPGRGLRPVTRMIDENGIVDVPQEATAVATKDGTITLLGVAPGSGQRISVDIPYTVTGHAAVPGQTAEDKPSAFEQILEAAQGAERAAQKAQEAAGTAKDEAQAGAEAASKQATASAQAAEKSAAQAEASASEAQGHSAQAGQYAQQTADAVALGQQAAGDARTDRLAAESAQQEATKHEQAAKDAATDAGTAKTAAEGSATAASESAELAKQQADAAGKSAILAQSAADTATEAKADAMDAQTAAEDAQDKALTAQTCAETAQGKAEDAAKTATGAADRAEEAAAQVQPIDDAAITTTSPWSSKQIVDTLCPLLEKSANPVVCYPVENYPLGVTVSWGPKQDGSGTPYPAGGGKNLWGDLLQDTFVSQQGFSAGYAGAKTTGKIPCAEGDKYTLSSVNTFAAAPGNIGVIAFFDADDSMLSRVANTYQKAFTLTAPANTAYVRASYYAETDADKVQLEKGSAATEYAPYANIRPITGLESVIVKRHGANLLNITVFNKTTHKGVDIEYLGDGGIRISGTATVNTDSPTFVVPFLPPGQYYGINTGTGISTSIVVTRNGSNLRLNAKGVFEILAGDVVRYWYMIVTTGTTVDKTIYPYIVAGTASPAVEKIPYDVQANTISLPSTIYGGEVDAQTGEGMETWKSVTFDGTEKWNSWGVDFRVKGHTGFYFYGVKDYSVTEANKAVCSHYSFSYGTYGGASLGFGLAESNSHYCIIAVENTQLADTSSTDAAIESFKSFLAAQYAAGTPVQIAYTLAEPVPFTATGGGEITALSGVNTILTDADTVAVTGREDIVHAISELRTAKATDVEG